MDSTRREAKPSLIAADINGSNDNMQSMPNEMSRLAKPLYLQRLESAFRLDGLINQVQRTLSDEFEDEANPLMSKQQLKAAKTRVYNLSKVKKSKKWLKNILLDKSDSSDSESNIGSEQKEDQCIREMLRFHRLQKKARKEFEMDPQLRQYQNYSSSLISNSSQSITPYLVSNKMSTKKTKASKKPKNVTNISSETPISAVTTTCEDTFTPTSMTDILPTIEKPLKTEKILDIPYDKQLPKDILQTESSNSASPFVESTPTASNYLLPTSVTNLLPDDIIDTEESSGSVLSQTLSQPTPTHPMTSFSIPKCATAPTTPTSLSPSSSPVIPVKTTKRSTKKKAKEANSSANLEQIMNMRRKRLWIAIARKEIPRAHKQKLSAKKEAMTNLKKMANWCQREMRKQTLNHQKQFCRDQYSRAKRLTKEMILYWKRFDKVEKDYRKRAEKEAQEQMKIDMELLEAKRQQRKLNFLITQTELYAHFMSKKMSKLLPQEDFAQQNNILNSLEEEKQLVLSSGIEDDFDAEIQKQEVIRNVETAFDTYKQQTDSFDAEIVSNKKLCLSDTSISLEDDLPQPKIFDGLLKPYQKKGMNWLYNLYNRGLNGILADEMGLGKTVQTIAFLATLAERMGIWGPFLIIAPSSTLHNWQQELAKFVPKFKILPYWGNPNDRKVLRKFWNQKYLLREDAAFHVLITSYQLIVQDVKYFQRIKWLYMVLDEAQAIKSSSSVRWKVLLSFQCRNRLLLTGTPIQNTMAELWALLHFIMPSMFDSHEEFNEWFSKDIESHAENKTAIDEKHLSRLHMILKPFMLRRIKKDVENELSDKIEIKMFCGLTSRQLCLYNALKNKISIDDLMATSSGTSGAQSATSSLMNLVMQFRKVCNHPNLFERRDVWSPYLMRLNTFILPRLLFESGLCSDFFEFDSTKHRLIYKMLNIFSCDHIHDSSLKDEDLFKCFSFLRLIGYSDNQLNQLFFADFVDIWQLILHELRLTDNTCNQLLWSEPKSRISRTPLLIPLKTTVLSHNKRNCIDSSQMWNQLLFTSSPNNFIHCFTSHTIHYMAETPEHRQLRLNKLNESNVSQAIEAKLKDVVHKTRSPRTYDCEPTHFPSFLDININKTNGLKVIAEPKDLFCRNQRAKRLQSALRLGGTPQIKQLIINGDIEDLHSLSHHFLREQKTKFFPSPINGVLGIRLLSDWSSIVIPDKETLVTDSGKLKVLDQLLAELKNNGHRVLIYSQMTRMIDLLEEFITYRKYKYMRLDGSSKISDRRDMVSDFQTRSDIFVFLLSTRAGGLGINLTAADTVIFYDSDWNPTVDQQAMDRAHRLGQTKQVTVYRLVCSGTIEERILQRAQEKSEIQRMVISGGTFRPETLKATEVVSLLLDDEELERRFRQRQEERRLNEETGRTPFKTGKRKLKKVVDTSNTSKCSKSLETNSKEISPTLTETDIESQNMESFPISPYSEHSIKSLPHLNDDESNEGEALLFVDDQISPTTSRASSASDLQSPSYKRGSGRSRGRPRGSRLRATPTARGRGPPSSAALAAAELAGAQAGKTAALAAYPFLSSALSGETDNELLSQRRGRGRGRSRTLIIHRSLSATKGQISCETIESEPIASTSQITDYSPIESVD